MNNRTCSAREQTVDVQCRQLNNKATELSAFAVQNERLHGNARLASAGTTALNKPFLRRVAADLHCGPGWNLATALMRFETIADTCGNCASRCNGQQSPQENFREALTTL